MRFRTLSRFFGLLLAASTGLASAADYYWDINGTTANGDGNGIFRASAGGTTWSTSPMSSMLRAMKRLSSRFKQLECLVWALLIQARAS